MRSVNTPVPIARSSLFKFDLATRELGAGRRRPQHFLRCSSSEEDSYVQRSTLLCPRYIHEVPCRLKKRSDYRDMLAKFHCHSIYSTSVTTSSRCILITYFIASLVVRRPMLRCIPGFLLEHSTRTPTSIL